MAVFTVILMAIVPEYLDNRIWMGKQWNDRHLCERFWIFCFELLKSTQKLGTFGIFQIIAVLVTNLQPSWLVVRLVIGHQAADWWQHCLVATMESIHPTTYTFAHSFTTWTGMYTLKRRGPIPPPLPVWCFHIYWYDSVVTFPASFDQLVCFRTACQPPKHCVCTV